MQAERYRRQDRNPAYISHQQLPSPSTHFRPHLFLYREQNLRYVAALLPAPPAPAITLHHISHLTGRHFAGHYRHYLGIAILPAAASPASASLLRQLSPWHPVSRKLFQLRINLSFRFLHFAIQKCIRISKLFISIRLFAVKHSHHFF